MQTIYLDISNKGVGPIVYAKQNEVGRKFLAVLTDSGIPYAPPAGSVFSAWYDGDSGDGNYTDIGEKSAFVVNGNKIEVELISQMISVPGEGVLCLVLNLANGSQIASWNIKYDVEPVPGADSEQAVSYYTAFSRAVENLPYPDASLTVSGKAADSAAVGNAIKDITPAQIGAAPAVESTDYPGCYYRTVNGKTEWENPPMVLGVEYRTTERFLGRPVYVKLVDVGALPSNSYKEVLAVGSCSPEAMPLFCSLISHTTGGTKRYSQLPEVQTYLANYSGTMNIQIITTADCSDQTQAYAIVKYTRE